MSESEHRAIAGKIFIGILAGLGSAFGCLLLAYFAGVVATGISTRDLFATLLTAATFLPIMLALVLGPPSLLIGFLTGLTAGVLANFGKRLFIVFTSLAGLVVAEIVLSGLLPLIVVPQPDDFTSIISNRYLSGVYGAILGAITGLLYRRFNS